ncbi:hypothetical protein VTN02DRAFT_3806 [Thermoascus thermophilus]
MQLYRGMDGCSVEVLGSELMAIVLCTADTSSGAETPGSNGERKLCETTAGSPTTSSRVLDRVRLARALVQQGSAVHGCRFVFPSDWPSKKKKKREKQVNAVRPRGFSQLHGCSVRPALPYASARPRRSVPDRSLSSVSQTASIPAAGRTSSPSA